MVKIPVYFCRNPCGSHCILDTIKSLKQAKSLFYFLTCIQLCFQSPSYPGQGIHDQNKVDNEFLKLPLGLYGGLFSKKVSYIIYTRIQAPKNYIGFAFKRLRYMSFTVGNLSLSFIHSRHLSLEKDINSTENPLVEKKLDSKHNQNTP